MQPGENNEKTVSEKIREGWNTLKVGDKITMQELAELVEVEEKNKGQVSSTLSRIASYGLAKRIGNKPTVYEKKEDYNSGVRRRKRRSSPSKPLSKPLDMMYSKTHPPTKPPEEPPKDPKDLDSVRIGNSIISVIEALKAKVKELSGEIRQLVEEKADVERCYRKAQEKIQELNNQCQSGKKSINLAELQETINGAVGKEGRG